MSHSTRPDQPEHQYYDDEIDLSELFKKIWDRKFWVVLITVVISAIALSYAMSVTPIYEVKSVLSPPQDSQLVDLKESKFQDFTASQIFQRFIYVIESNTLKREVFDAYYNELATKEGASAGDIEVQFDGFLNNLSFVVPKDSNNSIGTLNNSILKLTHHNPQLASEIVNSLVENALDHARLEMINDLEMERLSNIDQLNRKIEQFVNIEYLTRLKKITLLEETQKNAIQQKMDQIDIAGRRIEKEIFGRLEVLSEAIETAKTLKIIKPTSLLSESAKIISSQVSVNAELGDKNNPLYLRGVDFLQAEFDSLKARKNNHLIFGELRNLDAELETLKSNREIEILKARTNDALYIDDQLKPFYIKLSELNGINADYPNLAMARVDREATPSLHPIKPNKKLIVVLGVVLGLMLGLFIALVIPVIPVKREGK